MKIANKIRFTCIKTLQQKINVNIETMFTNQSCAGIEKKQ